MTENPNISLLESCDILYRNESISNSFIIATFANYLAELIDESSKTKGLIYHCGSSVFELLLTLYLALSCLVYDELTPQELIESLEPGDIVIYDSGKQKTRAELLEVLSNGSIRIKYGGQGRSTSSTIHTVPPSSFYKIRPYYGDATVLDGRGIRTNSKAKIEFMKHVFGKSPSDISGMNQKSAIIVCNRDFADSFVDEVRIRYNKSNILTITDLIPVSFYSENNETPYPGNPGKINPVLKFTNRLSVARDLIYQDEDRRVFAAAVLGGRLIKNGESELPDLLNRKSLKKIFLSLPIMEEDGNLYDMYPDTSVFACTKDMLLSYSLPTEPQGPLTAELETQVANILTREFIQYDVDGIISIDEYKRLRENIVSLRHHIHNDDLIDRFIIESYSLLNFLTNIMFPLSEIETARQYMSLECPSAIEKIAFLSSVTSKYTGIQSDLLSSIFCILQKAYHAVEISNPKKEYLSEVLEGALHTGTVLVLVPKSYYVDILKKLLPPNISKNDNLHIKIIGAFDFKSNYDTVVSFGCLGTKRFSIFNTFVAPTIECILYPHEQLIFMHQKKSYDKKERTLNNLSAIKYELTDDPINEQVTYGDLPGVHEIESYIEEISIKAALQAISNVPGGTATRADIVRIATTTEGESIFFTKYFTPYIFDNSEMTVIEKTVKDISAGDMLLFTKNSDQTKDIVEEIVIKIADTNEQISQAYRKSKHWKKRLLDYKEANNLSFQDLSDAMKEYGTPKHAVTLRTWLNPESRVIAPREEDAFYQIALICEDEEMLASPEAFHEACNTIRRSRIKILKLIGRSVIKSFQPESDEATFLSSIVQEELDMLSQVVHIDTIVDVSDVQISVTYANRPYAI